jgi:hypothetical protein
LFTFPDGIRGGRDVCSRVSPRRPRPGKSAPASTLHDRQVDLRRWFCSRRDRNSLGHNVAHGSAGHRREVRRDGLRRRLDWQRRFRDRRLEAHATPQRPRLTTHHVFHRSAVARGSRVSPETIAQGARHSARRGSFSSSGRGSLTTRSVACFGQATSRVRSDRWSAPRFAASPNKIPRATGCRPTPFRREK